MMEQSFLDRYPEFEDLLLNAPKIHRTHCYNGAASKYDIECPKCETHKVEWSEYESHIWCYECEKDWMLFLHISGIFSGPISVGVTEQIFGISLDRINVKTGDVIQRDSDEFNSTWIKDNTLDEYEKMVEEKFRNRGRTV